MIDFKGIHFGFGNLREPLTLVYLVFYFLTFSLIVVDIYIFILGYLSS